MTDEIGYFKGKPVSKMTREELLDYIAWSAKEIGRLNKIERETGDFRLTKEVKEVLRTNHQ